MLSGLREQYTDTHPDVRRMEAQLAASKKSRDQLLEEEKKRAASATPKKELPVVNTPQVRELDANIQRVQDMIQAKDMELAQYVQDQAQIDGLIKQYQQRIESSPLAEREYADLVRDYNLAKQAYDDLSMKKSHSAIATDLESRKQGEVLEVLDAASLPQTPTEPKRWLIISIGASLGLMLGLFLAGGREMKDTSLKNLKDVRAYTNLTVLGSVPLLESDLVVRRKRRLTWLAWSSASIVGFLVMIGSVYYYYTKGS
jgi:succinoglycan biosynthesis transport protein ExoP